MSRRRGGSEPQALTSQRRLGGSSEVPNGGQPPAVGSPGPGSVSWRPPQRPPAVERRGGGSESSRRRRARPAGAAQEGGRTPGPAPAPGLVWMGRVAVVSVFPPTPHRVGGKNSQSPGPVFNYFDLLTLSTQSGPLNVTSFIPGESGSLAGLLPPSTRSFSFPSL